MCAPDTYLNQGRIMAVATCLLPSAFTVDYPGATRPRLQITQESLNARYRRAVKAARGHFPTKQTAMKCLYLVTRSLDPKGTGQTWWAVRWKPAPNALAITLADRLPAAEDR